MSYLIIVMYSLPSLTCLTFLVFCVARLSNTTMIASVFL